MNPNVPNTDDGRLRICIFNAEKLLQGVLLETVSQALGTLTRSLGVAYIEILHTAP